MEPIIYIFGGVLIINAAGMGIGAIKHPKIRAGALIGLVLMNLAVIGYSISLIA